MNAEAAGKLDDLLAAEGFLLLGECALHAEDGFPPLPDTFHQKPGRQGHLKLIGSTGPGLWPRFATSAERHDGASHPLDRYTRRILGALAARLQCRIIYPFEGPPFPPFQKWALRSGGFSRSPIGVLTHEKYGPWAGFRAALIFPGPGRIPTAAPLGPCETCADKPCLSTCPVGAFSASHGYDVPRCRSHLASAMTVDCWSGCLARHACPVGRDHAPAPDNARFHMESFRKL